MIHFDFLDSLYPEWHAKAKCNGMDPAIWFPDTPRQAAFSREDAAAQAVAICGRCPVRRECADARDKHREKWGIWAGVDLEAREETDAA